MTLGATQRTSYARYFYEVNGRRAKRPVRARTVGEAITKIAQLGADSTADIRITIIDREKTEGYAYAAN